MHILYSKMTQQNPGKKEFACEINTRLTRKTHHDASLFQRVST